MRIAEVSPIWESTPPTGYGAVEMITSLLSDGLVERGHDVSLFASGDSVTKARLCPVVPKSLSASVVSEPEACRLYQYTLVKRQSASFDIIHSHLHSNTGLLGLIALEDIKVPVVHTLHLFLNPANFKLLEQYRDDAFVAISRRHAELFSFLNIIGVVPLGIDSSAFPLCLEPANEEYCAFVGRIRPEKGLEIAVQSALESGMLLKIAGRIKPQDQVYFDEIVRPHLGNGIEFVGELSRCQIAAFLGGASVVVCPTVIEEPFGLVAIEAMMCGTPVVALRLGAYPENIVDGLTGFLCDTHSFSEAIINAKSLSRIECGAHARRNFDHYVMVERYIELFKSIIGK